MSDPDAEVIVQIAGRDVLAGRLWSHRRGRAETQSFAYDAAYLSRPDAYELDPSLPLTAAQHHTGGRRGIFGAFSDCAPDRWGRRLAERDERRIARRRDAAPRTLGETDHLLRVRDDLRQGALRFRRSGTDDYLADAARGIPTLLELPELLDLAEDVERDRIDEDRLAVLVNAGSSLGGARPKAHVLDQDGRIAIAKFPSPSTDDWDVMRWEWTTLRLARAAGIVVPDSRVHRIAGRSVHVVDRFDRSDELRVGYVSAMTMLEAEDGDQGSYLEIADVIETSSTDATLDLRQLWRRVVFSILVSNFDDHLRNHGFLRISAAGWRLSPAFDINPDPRPVARHLHTAIDFDDTEARIDTALRVSAAFRLTDDAALETVAHVFRAVQTWPRVAAACGLDDAEIRRMRPAFDHAQTAEAARLVA